MGKRHPELNDEFIGFIAAQKLYFVGTAADNGTVNISPKGFDSLRVLSPRRVLWMNVTGSGNETAAHLAQNGRMTLMFCAFEGRPKILRLYGTGRAIHPRDAQWQAMADKFPDRAGARQFIDFTLDFVQTSCGFGVPLFSYQGEREHMGKWLAARASEGAALEDYWTEKNQVSLDGLPTFVMEGELPGPAEGGVEEGESPDPPVGGVEWLDLTVADADRLRDFYGAVIGWQSEEVPMGSYSDFNMKQPDSGQTVAGLCHARGSNAGLPSQWLVYVRVARVADSVAECRKRGGKVIDGPRRMAGSEFAVIEDPAGAVVALISK